MKKTIFVLCILGFSVGSVWASASNTFPQHPLYGKWAWVYGPNDCIEVYEFLRDGTSRVSSGAEWSESVFTVSEQPDENGFYHMEDVVTKSNGQTGCDGRLGGTPIGDKVSNYLFFSSSKKRFLICFQSSLENCIGPLKKLD